MGFFHYLSPLILPVLPRGAGVTRCAMNLQNLLEDVAADRNDVGLTITISTYEAGRKLAEESLAVTVKDGEVDPVYLDRDFSGDALGFVQIEVNADRPYFRKLHTEHVYSFIQRPDNGTFILNASYKFSDPLIIDLMRRVGRFCLVHPAQLVSQRRDIGNSTLIVNPFDGPIVATLSTGDGKKIKRKIEPKHTVMIGLDALLPDDAVTAVLYTGNNRYPAWDVRHSLRDPKRVNRIDHLEFFRGDPTRRKLPLKAFMRTRVRQLMRDLGLRH